MTHHQPASGPDSHGLQGQIVCANTIVYCEKWPETVTFYQTGLQLPVTVARDWFVEFRLTDTARLSIADAGRTTRDTTRGKGHLITFRSRI
ncbi:MAG: hypothetical protein U5K27_07305 [Desulfotignum sp.]|nr:hypothetical protein [Desulfotignum sp.]